MASPVAKHLDGDGFASALVSGIHRVIGDQEVLNRINVFPVADGDTGTNLSLSLGAVLDELPAGRGKIVTGLRVKPKVSDVTKFLKEQLAEGRQAYLVYPLVEESGSVKAQSATGEFEKWEKRLKAWAAA